MSISLRAAAASALCALLLAGCGTTSQPKPSAPAAPPPPAPQSAPTAPVPSAAPPTTARQLVDQYIRYRCENGFDFGVTYQAGGTRALVERSGYSDLLRLASSASGARYTDGKTTLSAKGDGAVLELPGGPTYRNCRSLPARSPPKG